LEVVMDDLELVARILRGEVERMGDLVQKYKHLLLAIALRFMKNREDAQDVVAWAWEVALKRLAQYEPARASLSTWLTEITIGLCWHERRKLARMRRGEEHERNCCRCEPLSPEERHELVVWHERLWLVLEQLPRKWQALLVLHLEEGWSYKQVGLAMDLTERQAEYETKKALKAAQELALALRENNWRLCGTQRGIQRCDNRGTGPVRPVHGEAGARGEAGGRRVSGETEERVAGTVARVA